MPSVTLPIRIRPNRIRMLFWALAWGAVSVPAAWFFFHQDSPIATLLLSPRLTWEFAAAVFAVGIIVFWVLQMAACTLASFPGAPFLHIELDEHAVTERIFWRVKRRVLRDVDSWGKRERIKIHARRYVPIPLYFYSVVPLPQGRDPERAHRQARQLLEIDTYFFSLPFADGANFAQELADCLTAAVTGARQSRRPVSIDISAGLSAQTFELRPRKPMSFSSRTESYPGSKPGSKPARLPGRFPTNQNLQEYWLSQAVQSGKASDDNPYTQDAMERAELYRQLAKRDRKRIARENRQKRLQAPGAGSKTQ